MANQHSAGIAKIPKVIENADFVPEPVSIDECLSTILELDLTSDCYRRLTARVNEKVKGLNWELEKFRVSLNSLVTESNNEFRNKGAYTGLGLGI